MKFRWLSVFLPIVVIMSPGGWPMAVQADDSIGAEKGTGFNLPERPGGCFAQIKPGPFFGARHALSSELKTPRSTLRKFFRDMSEHDYAGAAECLDLSGLDSKRREEQKAILAWKLHELMDGLGPIDLEKVSDKPAGQPVHFQTGDYPPIQLARNPDGTWQFNGQTIRNLDRMYDRFRAQSIATARDVIRNWIRDLFPDSLTQEGFLLPRYQWICLLVVVLIGILVDHAVRFVMYHLTMIWLKLGRFEGQRKMERGLWTPMGLLVRASCWYTGAVLIGLRPEELNVVLLVALQFFAVVAGVWTIFRLIDLLLSYFFRKDRGPRTTFDSLLVPLISRSLKTLVTCIGIVVFAETFRLPVVGVLSGMGLGGLALAFAAKDTLSNLFGSLTVLIDRPFEIGDWIKTENVEGIVELGGMRSTRVRTFYDSVITVPNSLLITAMVDNMGRRRHRRHKLVVGLECDTPPELVEAFCEAVRELIRRHPYTRKNHYHVYLNEFGEKSLGILVYFFLECDHWSMELRERHRLLIGILEVAGQLGVEIAFPNQTLFMYHQETASGEPAASELGDPLDAGRRVGGEIAGSPLPADQLPGRVAYAAPLNENAGLPDAGGTLTT